MAFNEKEKAIIQWGSQNGKTREETQQALVRFRLTGSPADTTQPTETDGVFKRVIKDIPSDIVETGRGFVESFEEGRVEAEQARMRVEEGVSTPKAGTLQTIGSGLRAGAEIVGETVLGLGKLFTTEKFEEKAAEKIGSGVEKVIGTQPVQSAIEKFESLTAEQQRNIKGGIGVVEGVVTVFGFGPIISKIKSAVGEVAVKSLKASDDVLIKARESIPVVKPIDVEKARGLFKDVRLKISDIDPQVETALKTSSFDDVNTYFQRAKASKIDPSKPSAFEIAGNKAGDAFDLLNDAKFKAISGKKAILDKVATEKIPAGTVSEVLAKGVREMEDKFGAVVDDIGKITEAKGRTLIPDNVDQKLIGQYFNKLNALGDTPTLKQVDDFVDWAQGNLYKQTKTLSKLEVASDPIIRQLQGMTGDLNTRLKTAVGGGYGEVNARIARFIELQDEISRALGADARKGAGLIKSLFSPAGANTRRIFEEIRNETGIDLFKEATLAKFAMESVGDVRQRSLLQDLGVGVEAIAEIDITKPASIIKWLRERADLDGQQLANELIRKFGDEG